MLSNAEKIKQGKDIYVHLSLILVFAKSISLQNKRFQRQTGDTHSVWTDPEAVLIAGVNVDDIRDDLLFILILYCGVRVSLVSPMIQNNYKSWPRTSSIPNIISFLSDHSFQHIFDLHCTVVSGDRMLLWQRTSVKHCCVHSQEVSGQHQTSSHLLLVSHHLGHTPHRHHHIQNFWFKK